MSATCTVAGVEYGIGRLDAIQQFHVSRRVAPLLASLGLSLGPEVLKRLREAEGPVGGELDIDSVLAAIGPMANVLSSLSDEHVDYVFATCLGVVTRKQPKMGTRGEDLWSPVMRDGRLMFGDVSMPAMIRLSIAVMSENLGDFWKELLGPPASPSS